MWKVYKQMDGRTDNEQLTITKGSLKLSVQVRWANKPNQTNSWLSPSYRYFIKDEPKRTIHTRYIYIMGKLISGIIIQCITNKSEILAIFLAFSKNFYIWSAKSQKLSKIEIRCLQRRHYLIDFSFLSIESNCKTTTNS